MWNYYEHVAISKNMEKAETLGVRITPRGTPRTLLFLWETEFHRQPDTIILLASRMKGFCCSLIWGGWLREENFSLWLFCVSLGNLSKSDAQSILHTSRTAIHSLNYKGKNKAKTTRWNKLMHCLAITTSTLEFEAGEERSISMLGNGYTQGKLMVSLFIFMLKKSRIHIRCGDGNGSPGNVTVLVLHQPLVSAGPELHPTHRHHMLTSRPTPVTKPVLLQLASNSSWSFYSSCFFSSSFSPPPLHGLCYSLSLPLDLEE